MGHEKVETTLNVYGHLVERVESKSEPPRNAYHIECEIISQKSPHFDT